MQKPMQVRCVLNNPSCPYFPCGVVTLLQLPRTQNRRSAGQSHNQNSCYTSSCWLCVLSARHQESRFNLIWAFFEWLEHDILEIWDFGKISRSHLSNFRKQWILKVPLCPDPNSHFLPSIKLFHLYGKMDLEKLITTNPIWDFFKETFDLL